MIRATWRLALLSAVAIAGCVLPISWDETGAPPLVAEFHRSDGTPLAGRHIGVSSVGIADCAHPQTVATTDDAGHVSFPRLIAHRRGVMIFPAFERFWSAYMVCSGSSDSVMQTAYEGPTGMRADVPSDTLSCLEWEWEGRARTTCALLSRDVVYRGRMEFRSVFPSGGQWRDDDATGWFRMIIIDEERRKPPYRRAVPLPCAYLQWIEEPSANGPRRVRATVELPLENLKVSSTIAGELTVRDGRPHAVVHGTRVGGWSDRDAMYVFALGAPGQFTTVVDGQ